MLLFTLNISNLLSGRFTSGSARCAQRAASCSQCVWEVNEHG